MAKTIYHPATLNQKDSFDWGQLTWFASGALGNSRDLTVGRCIIKPGCSNPVHMHPNCSEVLVVLLGEIEHTMDGAEPVRMNQGDVMMVEPGFMHQAKNVGSQDAVLFISFSSADRETRSE